MKRNRLGRGIGIALLAVIACFVFVFVTMHLWNWLMPMLFGLRTITYLQTAGLLLLCKILFGGFHGRPRGRRGRRDWARQWAEMSPEERERMQAGMRGRWGCGWGEDRRPAAEQKPAV